MRSNYINYPYMPIGMLGIYRLLFVFLFVRKIFGNVYLERVLT